jgi:hypothetical protein
MAPIAFVQANLTDVNCVSIVSFEPERIEADKSRDASASAEAAASKSTLHLQAGVQKCSTDKL